MGNEIPTCTGCGDDEAGLIKTILYGWICSDCVVEFERLDVEFDFDAFEEKKRKFIGEANEY